MMQPTDPASLPLRDIHLPDPVSWWPLAPGWWLLLFIVIAGIFLSLFLIKRHREKKLSAIFIANQEFDQIKNNFKNNNDQSRLIADLSALLRRISISIHKRDVAASLTNEDWLKFLDQYSTNNEFSQGVGRILVEGPYQPSPSYDSDELIALISLWFDNIKKDKRGFSS